jgi:YbgC/YbaW family acyl-CoA thioester hydrolase
MSEFVYRRRVQYRETDASGIVHFSCFFVYAEEAEHAMWRAAGVSVEPEHTSIGWPRVSASCDFFKALRFEDEFEVRIRLVERTAKTFRYQTRMLVGDEVVAIGCTTTICVRKVAGEPLRAIDIPAEIAERFTVMPPYVGTRRPRQG